MTIKAELSLSEFEATATIIDALLMRMSTLNRYSDDDTIITAGQLKNMDVVINTYTGEYGLVVSMSTYNYHNGHPKAYMGIIKLETGLHCIIRETELEPIRTIDELEARKARTALVDILAYDYGIQVDRAYGNEDARPKAQESQCQIIQ